MVNALETTFIANLIGHFGGNVLLFALFAILMFIILIALFNLPAIFSIPIGIFVASLFVTSGMATEFAFPVIVVAGFIIGIGVILKMVGN